MIKKWNLLVISLILCFIGITNVDAIGLKALMKGDKVCVDSSVLKSSGQYYIYAWVGGADTYKNHEWPGVKMTKETEDVYCYSPEYDNYSMVIFNNGTSNNGGNKQTIDLYTLGSGLIYLFDGTQTKEDNGTKYYGKWAIYDKSELVNLVKEVEKYNELDYTIKTYQNLLKVLNGDGTTIGASELSKKDYKDENMEIKTRDNEEGFYSIYEQVLENLKQAKKQLVKRHKVVIKDSANGNVSFSWKENSDTAITLKSASNKGYYLSGLKVTNITGYDGDKPILGNQVTELSINDSNNYDYNLNSDVYVEAIFSKKTYKLTFKVGKNGNIYNSSDKEISSPVTVEYDDDFTLKVVANEGYDVDKIIINGKEYTLKDGAVTIKNIDSDITIEVSFKIKSFIVNVDGKDYNVEYGTTYDDLLDLLSSKDNSKLKGLKDVDGNILDKNFKVTDNVTLKGIYDQKQLSDNNNSNVPKTPNTIDNITFYILMFIMSLVVIISIGIMKKYKYLRK